MIFCFFVLIWFNLHKKSNKYVEFEFPFLKVQPINIEEGIADDILQKNKRREIFYNKKLKKILMEKELSMLKTHYHINSLSQKYFDQQDLFYKVKLFINHFLIMIFYLLFKLNKKRIRFFLYKISLKN